jgi:replicative DNA helicase
MSTPLRVVRDDSEPEGLAPAHDLEAEASVLSAVILDPAALPRVADFLEAEMFYSEAHRQIYAAAQALRAAGTPVDAQTLASRLRDTQRLAQVGGVGYIAEVLGASPVVQNVRAHAETVHERWRVRAIQALGRRALVSGYEVADAQAYADALVSSAAAVARRKPGVKVETNLDTLKRLAREMSGEGHVTGATRGIPTGIPALDEKLLGLSPGQKVTLVAKPGRGKTAMGLQIAMNVARQGVGVMYFSTEMSRDELAERQLALLSSVDSRLIRKQRTKPILDGGAWKRLERGLGSLLGIRYRLAIHDDSDVTPEDICARVRAKFDASLTEDGVPLGLVVVDYVQRLAPSPRFDARKNSQKHEVIGHATKMLKQLAQSLGICVLELAQQKNSTDGKGKETKPALGDVAMCFDVEREADAVMYLWRPTADKRATKVIIAKQRGADEDDVDLDFEREFSRFRDPQATYAASPSRQYVAGAFDEDTWRAEP